LKENIQIKKAWEDGDLIQLEIICWSEFITARQGCYIQMQDLIRLSEKIQNFIQNPHQQCYLEFGNKKGNYTPAFSMELSSIDKLGHINIEVDVEIDDNDSRKHRSCFFVKSELGRVEQFGNEIQLIHKAPLGYKISLNI